MAAYDYEAKQHDFGESIEVTLEDAKGPIDLGNAERIHIYLRTRDVVAETGKKLLVKTGPMDVVAAEAGEAAYEWQEGDLDVSGEYDIEFEIIWKAGGGKTSVPHDSYKSMMVFPDLGEPSDLE